MALSTVPPYNHVSFAQFSSIFGDETFNNTKFQACKFDIELCRQFVTDKNQDVVFENYLESAKALIRLRKETYKKSMLRHYENELYSRYNKLRNLINNNTILMQHFGLPPLMSNRDNCRIERLSGYTKVCRTHLKGDILNDDPPACDSKRKCGEIESPLNLRRIKTSHLDCESEFEVEFPILSDITISMPFYYWNRF